MRQDYEEFGDRDEDSYFVRRLGFRADARAIVDSASFLHVDYVLGFDDVDDSVVVEFSSDVRIFAVVIIIFFGRRYVGGRLDVVIYCAR